MLTPSNRLTSTQDCKDREYLGRPLKKHISRKWISMSCLTKNSKITVLKKFCEAQNTTATLLHDIMKKVNKDKKH